MQKLAFKIGDKVCYNNKPYKIIGHKLDINFFVILGFDREYETIHYSYLTKI